MTKPVKSVRKGLFRPADQWLTRKSYKLDDNGVPVKSPFLSKTLWGALITAALAFFPNVQEFVKAHPELVLQVVAFAFGALRFVTKGAIVPTD